MVNSLRVGFDCDIYLTGSNAFLLSGELTTYLSGRYVEVKMLPLSFEEYADFCGLKKSESGSLFLRTQGDPVLVDDLMERYLTFGGMPALASLETTREQHAAYLSSLYETVVVRDVLDRERNASERMIRNPDLLRLICEFLANNVGNEMSAKRMADSLSQTIKTSDKTAAAYVRALNDAYVFYPARRYDLHGKALLKTLPKQYIVDLGLRSYLNGYRRTDSEYLFENAIYLNLLYRGWTVHMGKLYGKEVDFVCSKEGRVLYVQATDDMTSPQTADRELSPLRSIRDNYEKVVVVRQGRYPADIDGVKVKGVSEFFFGDL